MATRLQQHLLKWHDCRRCPLHNGRAHVVLVRGSIPAPILFCGEAPGESEDSLGYPFRGPAGKLFDYIIASAGLRDGTYSLTNLIACIPHDADGHKLIVPPRFAVEACAPRLVELVQLAKPQIVVWVGGEARRWGPKVLPNLKARTASIIHPAAILRMHVTQKGLAVQTCIAELRDAVEDA